MSELTFNGQGGKGYSTKPCSTNQYTGKMNDGALINKGRGPTKGNTGAKKVPSVAQVPSSVKTKNPDYINGGAPVRTPGGTKEFPKRGQSTFDFKRGPTKGNQQ